MFAPMVITARHFVKRAPSFAYSTSRSRKPSSPSVIFSPGNPASAFAPLSTLMPGMIPCRVSTSTSGVPSSAFCRSVSSNRMTPLMNSPRPRRREQHFAIITASFFCRFDADGLEPLLNRAVALVCGENAFPRRYERSCRLLQLIPWRHGYNYVSRQLVINNTVLLADGLHHSRNAATTREDVSSLSARSGETRVWIFTSPRRRRACSSSWRRAALNASRTAT